MEMVLPTPSLDTALSDYDQAPCSALSRLGGKGYGVADLLKSFHLPLIRSVCAEMGIGETERL